MKVATFLLALAGLQVHGCNRDDKEVGVCLHIYLERDFSAIEAVVYHELAAKKQATQYGTNDKRTLMMDGPELENNCARLRDMLVCFSEVLPKCFYTEDFFRYRHLIHSLNLTHEWLCSNPRERFLVMLRSVACVEQERNTRCSHPNLQKNIWQQLLRLEVGPEVCGYLKYQRECLVSSKALDRCGATTEEVYSEMSHIFLDTWCNDPSMILPTGAVSKLNPLPVFWALPLIIMWTMHR